MKKAIEVGRVTRVLKRYALDCNLNRDAIVVTGLASQRHVDSQGIVRDSVDINDTPYTNMCDWIETCDYKCAKPVDIDPTKLDVSTYDEYAVRWRETELKSAIRKLFEEGGQSEFQLADILDAMSDVPHKAISGLLSEIVGNQSFRIRMKSKEGYIVYRNGYFMFQPDYLSDLRIPLSLRVADIPIKRDAFDPAAMKLRVPVAVADAAAVAVAGPDAAPDAAPEIVEPMAGSIRQYWSAITKWAGEINDGSSIVEDIPPYLYTAIAARYVGDEQNREKAWLTMFNWLYDNMHTSSEYSDDQKKVYRASLAQTLVEFIWDESLRPNEQLELLRIPDDHIIRSAAREQIVKKGATEAFRFVDPITGVLKYVCGSVPCSDAVIRVFEANTEDPLRGTQANTTTTGQIYGFIVPKGKERRLIFKTSSAPPPPGGKPEKGGECAIISTISYHIQMLKEISNIMVQEGYPRFILTDDILDEKTRKRREEEEARAAGREGEKARRKREKDEARAAGRELDTPTKSKRTFENAPRACALKDIILRWMNIMQGKKGEGMKKYFYRPVAALKSGHKGTVLKG